MHQVAVIFEDIIGAEGNDVLGVVHGESFPPRSGWFDAFARVETNNNFREPARVIKEISPGPSLVDLSLEKNIGPGVEFMREKEILWGR